jgi:hypothetical protein
MFTPSDEIIQLLSIFAPCFSAPALAKAVHLVCGAILSPGRRTVASALRAVGREQDGTFGKYHRLLSRDRWSAMCCGKSLLFALLSGFVASDDTVEIVADETLERRRGKKISYKGWFRDPVRLTQNKVVTTPGVRWLCLCLLVPVPWSKRRWALPFCTVPVCSEKNCQKRGRLFRGAVGLTVDMIIKVRQWLGPSRRIRLVADGGFTNIDLIHHCNAQRIEQVGRLRLDAALYDKPAVQPKNKRGRKAMKGERQPSLKQRLADADTQWIAVDVPWYGGERRTVEIASGTALWHVAGDRPAPVRWVLVRSVGQTDPRKAVAFFSSDVNAVPEQIVACYARRWNIEVFFEEVRACLGFETQRGWSNSTIGRSTPCLFGVFSLIVLLAKRLFPQDLPVSQSAWYIKDDATFRDALSAVREHLWRYNAMPDQINKTRSRKTDDLCLIPRAMLDALRHVACYAT